MQRRVFRAGDGLYRMGKRRAGVGFIFITLFIDVLGFGLVIPIMPRLVHELSHSTLSAASRDYGMLLSLYGLMQFVFAPILGSLSDRWGRRPVLLLSLLCNGLDYVVLWWAPSLWWLYLGRTVSGITGASFSTGSAYIADVSPPEKRAQNFGLIGAAFGLGFIIGPAAGGVLGMFGPRVPFMAAAALSLVNWLYGFFILPESLAKENRRRFDWKKANPIGSFGLLSRYPLVLGLTLMNVCFNLGTQAMQSTWVLSTGYRYHWGSLQNGISLALVGVMSAVVQAGLMKPLLARFGERRLLVMGLAINVVSYVLLGLATQGWMLYGIIVFWGLGGVVGPSAQGIISRQYGPDEQGAAQGALTSLFSLTGIIGPLIGTLLFGYFVGTHAPIHLPGAAFFWSALLTFLGMLVALRTLRLPGRSEAPTLVMGTDLTPGASPSERDD